jgi:hypothetical protein
MNNSKILVKEHLCLTKSEPVLIVAVVVCLVLISAILPELRGLHDIKYGGEYGM